MTIRAKFTEISKLSDAYVYSQSTMLAGFSWSVSQTWVIIVRNSFFRRINLHKKDDYLAFHLEGLKYDHVKLVVYCACSQCIIHFEVAVLGAL